MLNCIVFTKNKMKKKGKNPTKSHNRSSLQASRISLSDSPSAPLHRGHPAEPRCQGRALAPTQSVISDITWISFLLELPGALELPCRLWAGAQGPGMASAPGLGLGSIEGWRKWFLGCWASGLNLSVQCFHACLPPWLPSPPVSCHL